MRLSDKTILLTFSSAKSYIIATAFVAANIFLPQLFHLLNLGGPAYLPILVFTLVAAIMFGTKTGIAVGVLSPVLSMLLFDMPDTNMCIILITKGIVLSSVLGYFAQNSKINLVHIIVAIAAYQLLGMVVATVFIDFSSVIYMLLISWPAVIIQIALGYAIIKLTQKNRA